MQEKLPIIPINLTDVHQLNSLVEHRTVYSLKNCQLNIFETYQQTKDVELSYNGLVVSSMMRGKKIVALNQLDTFTFVPGESIIVPKDQTMRVDFPEASFKKPVQCATIAMDWDVVQSHIDFLNEHYPLGNDGKIWELNTQHYHFYNNNDLAYSINKLISISMESTKGKDALTDLTFKTLILRIIQTQNLVTIEKTLPPKRAFTEVISYIQNNLDKGISADILARKAMMSKAAFFKAFKLNFGLTPVCYINQKRMEKAQMLLLSTNLHVNEITFECGFNNVGYFCKIFKQLTNKTPSEFRNTIQ